MNREKIICNVSEFYNKNKTDIVNTMSNIAYLFEHMCYEENPEKENSAKERNRRKKKYKNLQEG